MEYSIWNRINEICLAELRTGAVIVAIKSYDELFLSSCRTQMILTLLEKQSAFLICNEEDMALFYLGGTWKERVVRGISVVRTLPPSPWRGEGIIYRKNWTFQFVPFRINSYVVKTETGLSKVFGHNFRLHSNNAGDETITKLSLEMDDFKNEYFSPTSSCRLD